MIRRTLIAVLAALLLAVLGFAAPAFVPFSGGSGGPLTDRLNVPFTAAGYSSKFHVFAAGLDWSKEVGLLLYTDGSGGYGLDNPHSTYLLDADGAAGLVAVAKKHNLLLVTPEAPGPGCDGTDNCWYDAQAVGKAAWARAVVDHVFRQYPIEKERVAIGGYSSGAQFTSRWFVPLHGAAVQQDGVFVTIAYGGAPAVTPNFPSWYKASVHGHWNTGTADSAYSTGSWGAIAGHTSYRDNGFQTSAVWPQGVGHARGGEFAGIMDAQIVAHVRPAQQVGATTPPPPVEEPSACTSYCTTVSPTSTGGRQVLAGGGPTSEGPRRLP